jgi:hypothetical protein
MILPALDEYEQHAKIVPAFALGCASVLRLSKSAPGLHGDFNPAAWSPIRSDHQRDVNKFL